MQDPNFFGCNIFRESMLLGLKLFSIRTPRIQIYEVPLGQGVGWNDLKAGSHDATDIISFICTVTLNRKIFQESVYLEKAMYN